MKTSCEKTYKCKICNIVLLRKANACGKHSQEYWKNKDKREEYIKIKDYIKGYLAWDEVSVLI